LSSLLGKTVFQPIATTFSTRTTRAPQLDAVSPVGVPFSQLQL